MHKKGPAVRQRQKAAPGLTAPPCARRGPPGPAPTRAPPPAQPRRPPPYLGRLPPAAGVVPGGGAAVVVHEERPAGLGVHLDLPAGGQRVGAALGLEQRGVSGGAHGAAGPCAECRAGSAAPPLYPPRGGGRAGERGWKCLEIAAGRRRRGKGRGRRRRGGGGGGRRPPSCPAGNFWWPPARRAGGWGCPGTAGRALRGSPPCPVGEGFG